MGVASPRPERGVRIGPQLQNFAVVREELGRPYPTEIGAHGPRPLVSDEETPMLEFLPVPGRNRATQFVSVMLKNPRTCK